MAFSAIDNERKVLSIKTGGVAEWLIAMVLKTIVPKGTGGSNPSSSVINPVSSDTGFFYWRNSNTQRHEVT